MSEIELMLSAYIDGELSNTDSLELEIQLATDAELRKQLERLVAADAVAMSDFDAMLNDPVPAALVDHITAFQPRAPANED